MNQLVEEEDAAVVESPEADAQLVDQDEDDVLVEYEGESMVDTSPLACDKWNKKSIDWRYYTHQITPTVTGHAKEVTRQAIQSAQQATQSNVAEDEEYCPTAETVETCTLVLATV